MNAEENWSRFTEQISASDGCFIFLSSEPPVPWLMLTISVCTCAASSYYLNTLPNTHLLRTCQRALNIIGRGKKNCNMIKCVASSVWLSSKDSPSIPLLSQPCILFPAEYAREMHITCETRFCVQKQMCCKYGWERRKASLFYLSFFMESCMECL